MLTLLFSCSLSLVAALSPATVPPRIASLEGVKLPRATDGELLDIPLVLSFSRAALLVLGTYPADFNMIEYLQKLRHYLPALQQRGLERALVTVNGSPESCKELVTLLDLPKEIELLSDPSGDTARRFGCSQGWLPGGDLNPYLKLFGMLWGLGAAGTLPSVIAGYIGNPWGTHDWIETSMAQGQRAGRWPDNALILDPETGDVVTNNFDELPIVGGWGRRPLELATLRLQTMLGVSIAHWSELKPTDERCLTQLGGCVLLKDGDVKFDWVDPGICGTANFEDVVAAL